METHVKPSDYPVHPIAEKIGQSPPIDLDKPYDPAWVKGKTVLITGGASVSLVYTRDVHEETLTLTYTGLWCWLHQEMGSSRG